MTEPRKRPTVTIRYFFLMCNDIAAMRRFYTEQVGLEEAGHVDEEKFGYLVYQCDGFEFMFFRADKPLPVPTEWEASARTPPRNPAP